ncbi:hypothetical protein [Paracoccus sp. 22332]|uniref:hypothetical protein n=1 Tax=Paracoccus sp. 22332 TaxID=3453913 RepID=UPI003F87CAD7
MTKARTEAQKRRDRKARMEAAGLPGLAPIPRRADQGKARMEQIKAEAFERDADVPALEARCRQMGIPVIVVPEKPSDPDEDTREARKARHQARLARSAQLRDMRAVWLGCSAGRAIASVARDEGTRKNLWDAAQHMRRTVLAYDRALGAPNRHATCLRIMLPTETLQADATTPATDPRTDEERYHQAVNAWMAMHGWLGHVDARAASIALRTVVEDQPCRDPAALVRALHCVADGIAGRKVQYRGA